MFNKLVPISIPRPGRESKIRSNICLWATTNKTILLVNVDFWGKKERKTNSVKILNRTCARGRFWVACCCDFVPAFSKNCDDFRLVRQIMLVVNSKKCTLKVS